MAVVVGDAAVRVRPETDGFESEAEGGIVSSMGPIAAKAAAAFGAAFVVGGFFSEALEREALGDRLAASLGLTEERSAEVGAVAGNLYANAYGDSMESVNDAVAAVMTSMEGMADASSGELEGMTAKALDFAAAFQVDVGRATQVAGQLMRTGLAVDGAEAFDLLTVASQQVPAAIREDVIDAADEYGQFFASLGFTGRQAFTTLVDASAMGAFGIDKAGDAIKEFTIRATDMSAASVDAYDAIGLNAGDMANQILAGGDTAQIATQKVIEGLLGITDPAEQANTAIALFGTPLEDMNTSEIPAFLESLAGMNGELENVAGASDRMGQTLNDNASANLTSFARQAQSLAVDFLGGQLLPRVKDVAGFLVANFGPAVAAVAGIIKNDVIPAVKGMAEWVKENQTPIMIIAGIITAIFIPHLITLAAQAVITKVTVAAMWVASKVGAIQAAVVHSAQIVAMIAKWVALGVAAVAQGIIIATVWTASIIASAVSGAASFAVQVARVVAGWVLMGAQSLLQAGRMAAAWLIAMGPVGWVIAAVVGLVALIIANWERVKGWTIGAFQAIWGAVTGVFRGLVSGVSSALGSVVSFVAGLPGRILSAIGNLGSLLVNKGRDLIQGLVNGISGAARFVGNIARNVVNAVIGFINRNVIDGINNLLEFTVMGIHINPPDIPRIPTLHEGGVFTAAGGEGLALLRDQERVVTPEQRVIADQLLGDLLTGSLAAGTAVQTATGGGVQITNQITQQPGEDGATLAARVTQGTVWNLNTGITRRVGAGAEAFA